MQPFPIETDRLSTPDLVNIRNKSLPKQKTNLHSFSTFILTNKF